MHCVTQDLYSMVSLPHLYPILSVLTYSFSFLLTVYFKIIKQTMSFKHLNLSISFMTSRTGCLYMALYMENSIASLFPKVQHRSKSQPTAINSASFGHQKNGSYPTGCQINIQRSSKVVCPQTLFFPLKTTLLLGTVRRLRIRTSF